MSLILDGTAGVTFPNSTTQTGAVGQPAAPFTTNGLVYASSTSALATGSGLTFDGTNLGLGVNLNTWNSAFKAIQVGAIGSLSYSSGYTFLSNNWYQDATGTDKYITSNWLTNYYQYNGGHYWRYAASGTAGATVGSYTNAMTLDNTGQLMVGTSAGNADAGGGHFTGTIVQGTSGLYQQQIAITAGQKIQALSLGVGYTDLMLQSLGAGVLIGSTTQANTNAKLVVGNPNGSPGLNTTHLAICGSATGGEGNTGRLWFYQVNVGGGSSASIASGWSGSNYGNKMTFYTNGSGSGGDGSIRLTLSDNGSIGAPSGTNIYNPSDARLKQNVNSLSTVLDKVNALRPVSFNWIEDFCVDENNKLMYGFIAQEVQAVDETLVETFGSSTVHVNGVDIENPLRINEKFIIPLLTKAVQELSAQVAALQAKVGT